MGICWLQSTLPVYSNLNTSVRKRRTTRTKMASGTNASTETPTRSPSDPVQSELMSNSLDSSIFMAFQNTQQRLPWAAQSRDGWRGRVNNIVLELIKLTHIEFTTLTSSNMKWKVAWPCMVVLLSLLHITSNTRLELYGLMQRILGGWSLSFNQWCVFRIDIHSSANDKSIFGKLVEKIGVSGDVPHAGAHFFSEAGVVDLFLFLGPRPDDIFRQQSVLSGRYPLPPVSIMFCLLE